MHYFSTTPSLHTREKLSWCSTKVFLKDLEKSNFWIWKFQSEVFSCTTFLNCCRKLAFWWPLVCFLYRSPGGTPVRRRSSKCDTALLNDPAALIARALKKKFAQHRHNTSSDKENSLELSPFGSPDTPPVCFHSCDPNSLFLIACLRNINPVLLLQVSHHARRSQGRRHLLTG